MEKFSKRCFLAIDSNGRRALCAELSDYLETYLFSDIGDLGYGGERDEILFAYLDQLKALGHEMFSWDRDEDLDIFGYDYVKGGGFGLILEFEYKKSIEVYWKEKGGKFLYY